MEKDKSSLCSPGPGNATRGYCMLSKSPAVKTGQCYGIW